MGMTSSGLLGAKAGKGPVQRACGIVVSHWLDTIFSKVEGGRQMGPTLP